MTRLLSSKFSRSDIESAPQVVSRVLDAFAQFQLQGQYLVYTHSGVLQSLLFNLHIHDLYILNCGSLSFVLDDKGTPQRLIAYWNHGH